MDSFRPSFETPYQSDYLHLDHEKFWEIRVYNSGQTLIRCGRLGPDAQEEASSVQTVEKSYAAIEDARHGARKLVETKMTKGYKYLDGRRQNPIVDDGYEFKSSVFESKPDESLKRGPPVLYGDDIVTKQVKLDPFRNISANEQEEEKQMFRSDQETSSIFRLPIECKANISDINVDKKAKLLKKALEMDVTCSFEGATVTLKGNEDDVQTLRKYIKQLQNEAIDQPVSIAINPKLSRQSSDIEKYALELGLVCEVKKDKVVVLGDENKVEAFKAYIIVKEADFEVQAPKKMQESPKKVKDENEFTQHEMDLSWNLRNQKVAIENKLRAMGLFYEIKHDKLYVLGPQKTIMEIADFLFALERNNTGQGLFNNNNNTSLFNNTNNVSSYHRPGLFNNNYTQPNYNYNNYNGNSSLFNNTLASSNTYGSNNLFNNNYKSAESSGEDLHQKFLTFLADEAKKKVQGPIFTSSNPEDFEQRKITLSPIHRGMVPTIQTRAKELELIIDFEGNVCLAAGHPTNVEKFTRFVDELGETGKRTLYPKNWDFFEKRQFARTRLMRGTPEYREVADRFYQSAEEEYRVTAIHKIHNTRLMDQHIDNIFERMKKGSQDPFNRRLLFQVPLNLYVDPASNPAYYDHVMPHSGLNLYRHACDLACEEHEEGTMYLCDVYVGKQAHNNYGSHLPLGFDSIKNGDCHIIHDSRQSYPMYQIDYRYIEDDEDEEDDY